MMSPNCLKSLVRKKVRVYFVRESYCSLNAAKMVCQWEVCMGWRKDVLVGSPVLY